MATKYVCLDDGFDAETRKVRMSGPGFEDAVYDRPYRCTNPDCVFNDPEKAALTMWTGQVEV
jgi:hypothetical protein